MSVIQPTRHIFTHTVSKKGPIKEVIKKHMRFSTRLLNKCKRNKSIYLNNTRVTMAAEVAAGDVVKIILPPEENIFQPDSSIKVRVEYEDEDIMMVNKQPNIVVYPTKRHPERTLANGLAALQIKKNQNYKIRFGNRIDRDTSGLVFVAKNSYAHACISKQMQANAIEKKYLAVVQGSLEKDCGTIDLPIGLKGDETVKREVFDEGKASTTHYKVIERINGYTILEVTLETGRTHQIRVHFSYLGHPLVGDTLYGEKSEMISRQALHAWKMVFNQPRTNKTVSVEAKWPSDIKTLIMNIRNRSK